MKEATHDVQSWFMFLFSELGSMIVAVTFRLEEVVFISRWSQVWLN